MVMTKKTNKERKQTMTKENPIGIELSEIVREFEGMDPDKIAENFTIKTFKNGKVRFYYKNDKQIYFSIQRVSHSYDEYGYDLEIDFYANFLSKNFQRVLKDIEDFKIYFEPFHEDKFKKFLFTDLYRFLDDIVDLNNYMDLNNVKASDAYRLEKSIVSA